MRPSEVDLALVYDGFTFNAISWIEGLGFCGFGEAYAGSTAAVASRWTANSRSTRTADSSRRAGPTASASSTRRSPSCVTTPACVRCPGPRPQSSPPVAGRPPACCCSSGMMRHVMGRPPARRRTRTRPPIRRWRQAERSASRKGIETRARLLGAAKEVFEQDGFLDARISDIAERAGLSHGSFYHYFESKEEVFREVAAEVEQRLSEPLYSVILDAARPPPLTSAFTRGSGATSRATGTRPASWG